jgi:hypothetical protein
MIDSRQDAKWEAIVKRGNAIESYHDVLRETLSTRFAAELCAQRNCEVFSRTIDQYYHWTVREVPAT